MTRRFGVAMLAAACVMAPLVSTTTVSGAANGIIAYHGAGRSVPKIGIITDSSGAGIRWTNSSAPLRRFNFLYDGESCRRTYSRSCRGREGRRPPSAYQAMRNRAGQWGNELMVMVMGYNDPGKTFGRAVDAIVGEARRQGIKHVMWLTLRTADVSYVSPTYYSNAYTFYDNNKILLQKAEQYGGYLQIADYATWSTGRKSWFSRDGVHYTRSGAWATADYIAQMAARVIRGETITPGSTGDPGLPAWAALRLGSRGILVEMVQNALHRFDLWGNSASGVFDTTVANAVKRFQAAHGLPVTGVVDSRTAAALGIHPDG